MRLALAVLAVWRIAHLLAKEDGPWDLIVRLRRGVGNGLFGKLMDCFQCLSLWVAIPFAFFVTVDGLEWFVAWPAISGAACLLERAVREPEWMVPAAFDDQKGGTPYGLLRPETRGGEPFSDEPPGDKPAGGPTAEHS